MTSNTAIMQGLFAPDTRLQMLSFDWLLAATTITNMCRDGLQSVLHGTAITGTTNFVTQQAVPPEQARR